ncbi:MAG: hypothetical protein U0903_16780 [Planctomycetales bacterium]
MLSTDPESRSLRLLSRAPMLAWDPVKIGAVLLLVLLVHGVEQWGSNLWFVRPTFTENGLQVLTMVRGGELGTFSGTKFGWNPVSAPLLDLVIPQPAVGNIVYILIRLVLRMIVWGGVFILISRSVVDQLEGKTGRAALIPAATGALKRCLQTILGPVVLVLGILGLLFANILFGWFCAIPLLGKFVGGLLLIIPLLVAIIAAVLMFVMILGWPVMMAMAGIEDNDGIEIMKRTTGYLTSHPILFGAHVVLVSFTLGLIGYLLSLFAAVVHAAVVTPLAWGVGQKAAATTAGAPVNRPLVDAWSGNWAAQFWLSLPAYAVEAYLLVLFATAMTLVYLLIRKRVEGTAIPGDVIPTGKDPIPTAPAL